MATLANLVVGVLVDTSEFKKAMQQMEKSVTAVQRSFDAALPASKALAAAVGVAAGAFAGAAVKGVQLAGQMEQTRMAFTTLLGSATEADSFIRDMWDFAAHTPFDFQGVTDAAKKLLAFKFEAQDVKPILTAVGDAVAGLGGGADMIDRVTTALGQMKAKGKVSAEEMMQLTESGINAWQYLAQALNTDVAGAMQAVQKRAVDSAMAVKVITEGMEKDFGGMMDVQSRTLLGMWSTLQDNVAGILRGLGEQIIKTFDLGGVLARINDQLGQLSDLIQSKGLIGALEQLFPPDLQQKITLIAGALAGALTPALIEFTSWIVKSTLALTPWMIAGAALAALAYTIYQNWQPISDFFREWADVILPAVGAAVVTLGVVMAPVIASMIAGWWAAATAAAASAAATIAALLPIIGPVLVVGAAVAGLALIWHEWGDDIKQVVGEAVNWVSSAISNAWQWISSVTTQIWQGISAFFQKWWPTLALIFLPGVGYLIDLVVQHWDQIKNFTSQVWDSISGTLASVWNSIRDAASSAWTTVSDAVSGPLGTLEGWIAGLWQRIKDGLVNAWGQIKNAAASLFKQIADAIVEPFRHIHIPLPHFSFHTEEVSFAGITFPVPKLDIQWYAQGGIIPEPVIGVGLRSGRGYGFGEAGPEAVVPLRGSAAGPGEITVIVELDGRTIARALAQPLADEIRLRTGLAY